MKEVEEGSKFSKEVSQARNEGSQGRKEVSQARKEERKEGSKQTSEEESQARKKGSQARKEGRKEGRKPISFYSIQFDSIQFNSTQDNSFHSILHEQCNQYSILKYSDSYLPRYVKSCNIILIHRWFGCWCSRSRSDKGK